MEYQLTILSMFWSIFVNPDITRENLYLLTFTKHSLFLSIFCVDWAVCIPVRMGSLKKTRPIKSCLHEMKLSGKTIKFRSGFLLSLITALLISSRWNETIVKNGTWIIKHYGDLSWNFIITCTNRLCELLIS